MRQGEYRSAVSAPGSGRLSRPERRLCLASPILLALAALTVVAPSARGPLSPLKR